VGGIPFESDVLVVRSTLVEYNVSGFQEASRGAAHEAEHFAVFSVPEKSAEKGFSTELVALGCGDVHESSAIYAYYGT
jgi:hypothetical protein